MRQVRRQFLIEWVLMFLLLPSAIVWFDSKPGLVEANADLYDRMLRDQPLSPSQDILIIGIDKRTLDALGAWPIARSLHARLLEQLAPHAPRAVLLDIFFDGPAADTGDDELLASAISRVPTFLPLAYTPPPLGEAGEPIFAPPIPVLAASAAGIGHANATPDSDGLIRGIWRHEGNSDHIWPYVGNLIADHVLGRSTGSLGIHGIGRQRRDRFGIAFAGPPGTYSTVPYIDALRGDLPDEMLRGKVVLVGAVGSSGLGDMMPVAGVGPLTALPGIEIHANALDALIGDHAIEVPMDWRRILWISVPVWIVLLLFLRTAVHAVAITFTIAASCIVINYFLLVYGKTSMPLASPLSGIVLAYLLWSWRRLNALMLFFRQRADALNAVPAGAFEVTVETEPLPLESVERRTHALDRAIDRLTRLQSLLTEGVWQLPVPVLICRPDGTVSQSNAAARELLLGSLHISSPPGSPSAEDGLKNKNLLQVLLDLPSVDLPDSDAPSDAPPWGSATRSEFTTKQGNVFRFRAAALANASSETAPGWVVVLPDVTTERRAQREREQWFGFLSHDLRSPQVTILSLLALYSEGAPGIDIESMVKGIGSEARRTIHLAESFMDMVEAESGVYRFAPTFTGSIVLDAIDATWASAQANGLTLKPRLGASDCSIMADSSLLTRAVVNLIANAIRFSTRGSTIFVCVEASIGHEGSSSEALISIQDDGSGMNADQVSRILNTDERRRSNNRGTGQGWGIGMSIVHAVVLRHGGWIDVISAPAAGSTFILGFPLAPDEPT